MSAPAATALDTSTFKPAHVVIALALSLSAHWLVLSNRQSPDIVVPASGDADLVIEALGTSFESLLETAPLEPVEADSVEPVPADPTPAAERGPVPIGATLRASVAPTIPSETVETPTPDVTAPNAPETVGPVASDDAAGFVPSEVPTLQTPLASPSIAELDVQAPLEPVSPVLPSPAVAETITATRPIETIQPLDLPTVPQPVDTAALRPDAQAIRERVLRETRQQRQTPAPSSTAPRTAIPPSDTPQAATPSAVPQTPTLRSLRGDRSSAASQSLGSTQATPSATVPAPGNQSAIDDYERRVFARIRSTRQQGIPEAGTTQIQFSISTSGSLASSRISASSGSSTVDQAALDLVRRAAPFPNPPAGAQTTFIVPIRFR
ncbi:MAG: TonB family protein [Pseudomonadota bacterium]